jgi:selenocysteine lyase/cysteine desulfurase
VGTPTAAPVIDIAEARALFPGLRETVYFNTATMAVGSTPARAAYDHAVAQWSAGRFDWLEAERAGEAVRADFAELIGAGLDEIAIVPAVSTAAGLVAANLPSAGPGENIVVAGNEFSSNFFPWLLLRERGYDVRTVSAPDGSLPVELFEKAADGGTRLIAVSAVHSLNGFRTDLPAVSRVAARSGARLFVDAAQAAGAVPVDVVRDGIDFLAAASYKYLLSSRGVGYLYVRRQLLDRMHPVGPGWKAGRRPLDSFYGPEIDLSPTASKLDTSLMWFSALATRASLGIFSRFGVGAIIERNAQLSRRLHEALGEHCPGFHPFPESHRSPIVSLPVADPAAVMERLRAANVVAAVRAGRVRLSVHFYNLEEEIDRVAELVGG